MDLSLTQTPLYKIGAELMQAGRFNDAADHWGDTLEAKVGELGEMHLALAPIYFQYGSAMLALAEESAAGDVASFKQAIEEAAKQAEERKAAAAAAGESQSEAGTSKGGDSSNAAVTPVSLEQSLKNLTEAAQINPADQEEELQLAWENMDLARALYNKIPNPDMQTRVALARVHDRLADLHHANGNNAGVVDELEQELEHVSIALPPNCALQAELRMKLGTAYLNCATQAKDDYEKAQNFREHSAIHQEAAAGIFEVLVQRLEAALSNASGKPDPAAQQPKDAVAESMQDGDGGGSVEEKQANFADYRQLVIDLRTTSRELREEMKRAQEEQAAAAAAAESAAHEAAGVETIGFGQSKAEGESASSTATAAPVPVNVVSVKRKRKDTPASTTTNGTATNASSKEQPDAKAAPVAST